jgi:beta-glucosidase
MTAASALAICGCSEKDETEKKIDDLLSRMTLHEKIGQMNQLSGGDWLTEAAEKGEVGSVLNCVDPAEINRIQKAAVERSRLGIPILVSRDVIHGFKTIFPIPLGLAATFDPELVESGARVAAVEAASCGVRWTFSPMLDISRDPRWGRIAESSGEDPYLDAVMGAAMVRGYQGNGDSTSIAACLKHFVGYGATEGGRDYNTVELSERTLRNIYFPAFQAGVDAGAMTLMTSFNTIDGVPSTGNKWLLQDVLRGEWGFDGMIVTDWNSSGEMIMHGFAKDLKDATDLAVNAGVEMDMMSYGYISFIEELVKEKKISEKQIDDAVRDILRLKFRLGLFDNPYVNEEGSKDVLYAPSHLEAAKQSAIESAILLKNDNALPLKDAKTLLVTGPLADAPYEQMGTWAFDGDETHSVTPLAALKKDYNVIYEPGTAFSRDRSTAGIAKAKAAASRADAIVVFAGEEAILSGEAHCLSDLNLQGAQSELIAAMRQTGKKVIVVVMAGRPLTIGRDLENCDAMLYSFHPGTMGGEAIADLLSGKAVPSGKTPVTFLKTVGQAPMYYNHLNTGRPNTGTETLLMDLPLKAGQTSNGCTSYYLDSGYGPLFPFGYGLSYTTFEYSDIALDSREYTAADTIKVKVTLKNSGEYTGTEVAQLYVRDLVGSIARPVKELKGFQRVALNAGESKVVDFSLPVSALAFWNINNEYIVEPGDFQLWVATDSASGEPVGFTVR